MISGGLGVACYGLAKALNAQGIDVLFVLPRPRKAGSGQNGHAPRRRDIAITKSVHTASAQEVQLAVEHSAAHAAAVDATDHAAKVEPLPHAAAKDEFVVVDEGREIVEPAKTSGAKNVAEASPEELQRVTFVPVDAWLRPYMSAGEYQKMVAEEVVKNEAGGWVKRAMEGSPHGAPSEIAGASNNPAHAGVPGRTFAETIPPQRTYIDEPPDSPRLMGTENTQYAGDLFSETQRYARLALAVARNEKFSVVHGHDWMTFEAAMAVAAASGKPLVLQIHSTELDRAGAQANRHIMEIERQGMLAANLVIAVSYKTKTQLIERYGIDPRKIEVVYNATDERPRDAAPPLTRKQHKRVLFLGRLTRQKGPGYFLQAAKKVLSMEPSVKFVMAGQGEMEAELKELAEELGIRKRVLFAGFLQKEKAAKALEAADVYVMPSVSEPFGIAPLEALAKDVPVIISKQSGVAEVLRHVLKVDFWDTDDLANKILAVLRHAPLAQTLREQGQREVRQMSWNDSAERIVNLYDRVGKANHS